MRKLAEEPARTKKPLLPNEINHESFASQWPIRPLIEFEFIKKEEKCWTTRYSEDSRHHTVNSIQ